MKYRTLIAALLQSIPLLLYSQTLLEPPDGRVYHGIQTAFGEHIGYLLALNDMKINPAVRGTFISIPGTRPPATTFNGLRQFLAQADSIGFVPEISLFLLTSGTNGTDSVIAVSSQYDYFIDSLIAICVNYNKRMFVRIGPEFNGWWFGQHAYYYPLAFRKIVDRYAAFNFRDSIATNWCYEPDAPNDFDSVGPNGPLWYPGDAYVDWFGLDVFDADHFDQSLPDTINGGITKKGKSERFLAMARSKGKPVFLSETSAKGVDITADSLDSVNDWNAWFVKFWQFMDNHLEIKGFNYINQDWENTGYPGWGNARIQNSPYITAWYRQEMHQPRYIHLHSPLVSVAQDVVLTQRFYLYQNYPNPFNSSTSIHYDVPYISHVKLAVFDLLGRKIAVLVDDLKQPGSHEAIFDASQFASGIYLYRIETGNFTDTKKLILLR